MDTLAMQLQSGNLWRRVSQDPTLPKPHLLPTSPITTTLLMALTYYTSTILFGDTNLTSGMPEFELMSPGLFGGQTLYPPPTIASFFQEAWKLRTYLTKATVSVKALRISGQICLMLSFL